MIGSPSVIPPDVRSQRGRFIREFVDRKKRQSLMLADYVEQHPESVQTAIRHVDRFLASPGHIRIHWVLNLWRSVLKSSNPQEVAAILRDDSPETESLRESPPYFGPPDR